MKPLKNKKESTKQRRRKLRNRLISVLTAAVVFTTTYALVLPAITMDAETANAMPGIDVAQPTTEQVAAEPIAAEPIAAEPVAAEAPAETAPAVEPAAEPAPAAPAAEAPTQVIADENVPMAAPDAAATVTPEPVKSESVVDETSSSSSASTSADSTEAADAAEEEKKDDAAEEKKDEEKEEEKEDEAKLAASPLTFDCAEYLVTVSFSEAAALPEGTTLSVREYGAGSMEYNNYHAILNQKLREDGVAEEDLTDAVSALRFYELSFINKDGAQILPASAVDVLVEYKTPTNPVADESLYAVTFRTDDGQPTKATLRADAAAGVIAAGGVIQKLNVQGYAANDTHTNNVIGQLVLKQNGEETEDHELITTLDDEEESLTTQYLTADGAAYNITMTYGPEAGIPEGAALAVSEIPVETEVYEEYVSKTEDALGDFEKVTFARFFDINIMYEGAEIQPNGPVNVKIELADALTEDVKVVHFEHDDAAAAETPVVLDSARVEADAMGNAVGFEADSFSVYGVVESETLTAEVLTHDGESYRVTLTFGPEAKIPSDARLEVREIEKESDEYFVYYNKALRESGLVLSNSNYDVNELPTDSDEVHEIIPFMPDARFFDISIWDDDNTEIEPEAPVKVNIEYLDDFEMGKNGKVSGIHFTSNEVQIKEAKVTENADGIAISHTQDSFSVTGDVVVSEQGNEVEGAELEKTASYTSLRAAGENKGPETTKTVRDNGNGTHTIRLDILGEVEQQEEITKANVVVILDLSGSMNEYAGYTRRIAAAKSAVNNIAQTLLTKNNKDGITGNDDDDVVEMALISFNATAVTNISSTTTLGTYTSAVNNLSVPSTSSPQAGTNWEDALQEAANVTFDNDGDPTYVIFVSDGEPTFRNTNGGYDRYVWYNRQWNDEWRAYDQLGVYGYGSESLPETITRCYTHAVDDAQAIVSSGRQFYTIGAFGTIANMRSLTTASGAPADHYYSASSSDDLARALNEIADAITKNLGFSNVSTSDGVTALSSISAKVVDGNVTGFRYYKNGAVWADAPEATPTADGITWDLSSENPLADQTTYSIEFDIWPSQEAYDTVANLNNGLIAYADLPQTTRDQINDNGDGTYSLKTNTSLTTTYTKNGVTDTDEWDKGNSAMSLDVRTFKVRKHWNNSLDGRDTSKVQLIVTKDGENYLDGDHIIELTADSDGNMISDDIFISCGFITHESTGYDVKEHGHDYSIKEPENYSYYWDLTAAVYRPMVIDGTPHMLVKTDSPTGTDGTDYYVIDGNSYQVRDTETILEATNDRRSYLNLSKTVTDDSIDQSADPDALFEYTLTVGNTGDDDIWFSAQDSSGATQTISDHSSNVSEEIRSGAPTGYYYVPAGTEFRFSIKDGWNVRFTNLPTGTSYTIRESNMPEGFEFTSAEASANGDDGATAATISGQSANGTINKANTDYTVAYTNKWVTKEVTIVKVDENNNEISDAAFTLTTGNPETTVATFVSDATDEDLGNKFKLPYGVYCLTETEAPDGYIILKNKIYFKVDATNGLMLCDKDGEPATYEKVSIDATNLELTVENTPGKELPNTGGTGTLPFTLGGIGLILASALMYGFRMRRRERRLH